MFGKVCNPKRGLFLKSFLTKDKDFFWQKSRKGFERVCNSNFFRKRASLGFRKGVQFDANAPWLPKCGRAGRPLGQMSNPEIAPPCTCALAPRHRPSITMTSPLPIWGSGGHPQPPEAKFDKNINGCPRPLRALPGIHFFLPSVRVQYAHAKNPALAMCRAGRFR